jgi:hypothetical protein
MQLSSFLWVRFRYKPLNNSSLNDYLYTALQRQVCNSAMRLEVSDLEDQLDRLGLPKLRTSNHDADSLASPQYRKLNAQLESNQWMRMNFTPPVSSAEGEGEQEQEQASIKLWLTGVLSPHTKFEMVDDGYGGNGGKRVNPLWYQSNTELRMWRWGAHWLPSSDIAASQRVFECIEELRCLWWKDKLLEPPTVTMAEYPPIANTQSSNDPFGHQRSPSNGPKPVPVGGFSSFVWPDDTDGLFGLFADALAFQCTVIVSCDRCLISRWHWISCMWLA